MEYLVRFSLTPVSFYRAPPLLSFPVLVPGMVRSPLKKGAQHYRLLPKERDHDTYLAIVNDRVCSQPTIKKVFRTSSIDGKKRFRHACQVSVLPLNPLPQRRGQ
jgi:hypothetical protein